MRDLSRGIVLAGCAVVVGALTLVGCGGGDDRADSTPSPAGTPHRSAASTPSGADPTRPTETMPSQDDPLPSFTDGVELSQWLPFGPLNVRATDYQRAGVGHAATGTRIDVVTVEECATASTVTVRHQTWHLVDARGHTLGVAGGKIVNGQPTEDIPRQLYAGACEQTKLAIGVAGGSRPVAVKDGAENAWLLPD